MTNDFGGQMMKRQRKKSGWVLIVALVAIAIFTGIATTSIRSLLTARRGMKTERDLLQLQLLCDGGEKRAEAQYREDPGYNGEVWFDRTDAITGHRTTVSIAVETEGLQSDSQARTATILARMEGRNSSPSSIQRTKQIQLVARKQ